MKELQRFTKAERLFHWSTVAAVLGLFATGLPIWQHLDKWKPGGINVLVSVHVWLFGALLVLGALTFLITRRERVAASAVRFNPGQRFNLLAFEGLIAYLLATGSVRYVGKLIGFPRATLTTIDQWHFAGAVILLVLLLGHLAMVLLVPKNRGILAAMTTGHVPEDVARSVAPAWVEAVNREADQPAPR